MTWKAMRGAVGKEALKSQSKRAWTLAQSGLMVTLLLQLE